MRKIGHKSYQLTKKCQGIKLGGICLLLGGIMIKMNKSLGYVLEGNYPSKKHFDYLL